LEPDASNGPEIIAPRLWRRFLLGGKGPELSLAETAAAIGVSVSKAARLVHEGKLLAHKDPSGRYKVIPLLDIALGEGANFNARLWDELRSTLRKLEDIQRERDQLQSSLTEAQEAAVAAQQEVTRLWPLLAQVRAAAAKPPEAPKDPRSSVKGQEHVRSVVIDAREAFRRRRSHWRLVG
jgi:hypothetical protein